MQSADGMRVSQIQESGILNSRRIQFKRTSPASPTAFQVSVAA
jgi:hypothetical protein